MIILFIIVGLIYDWGGINGHPGPVSPFIFLYLFFSRTQTFMEGLSNFKDGQAFIGGFSAFAANFVYAFYSFGVMNIFTKSNFPRYSVRLRPSAPVSLTSSSC
jgi:amino acid permease